MMQTTAWFVRRTAASQQPIVSWTLRTRNQCRPLHVATTSGMPVLESLISQDVLSKDFEDIRSGLVQYSAERVHRVSLGEYASFGQQLDRQQVLKMSSTYVHRQGMIRLAHMVTEMNNLPITLFQRPEMAKVFGLYVSHRPRPCELLRANCTTLQCTSFQDLLQIPLRNVQEVRSSCCHWQPTCCVQADQAYADLITSTLDRILERHVGVVVSLARVRNNLATFEANIP